MAGDWIKMRCNLWDDPRVSSLCEATNTTEATVVGGLYWLWATADQHSSDGLLPGMTARALDRKCDVPGLGAALVQVGWLEETQEGLRILNFSDHNGETAKSRAQTARRVAKSRANNAPVTGDALPTNADSVTGALAREDKREEKNKNKKQKHSAQPAADDLFEGVDPQVAADFKALRTRLRAPVTATVARDLRREAEKAGMSVESVLEVCCVRGWRAFKADWVLQGGAAPRASPAHQSAAANSKSIADRLTRRNQNARSDDIVDINPRPAAAAA